MSPSRYRKRKPPPKMNPAETTRNSFNLYERVIGTFFIKLLDSVTVLK
jgi:hypothetical protein